MSNHRGTAPSLKSLQALLYFFDEGGVQAAAKKLGVKQPAVSGLLKVFREDDELLLRKRGQKLELTDKGRQLLPAIRNLLGQYKHLVDYLVEKQTSPQRLLIGTGASASQYYLPSALARFRDRMPGWEVHTQVRRGRERILGTAAGIFDLAIVSHDSAQIQSIWLESPFGRTADFEVEELCAQPLCVLAALTTPEGRTLRATPGGQQVALDALAGWTLVGLDRESGVRRQVESYYHRRPRPVRFGLEAGSWLAAKEYVRHGLGVALVPPIALVREDRRSFAIRRLEQVCVRDYVVQRKQLLNDGQQEMKRAVREAARDHLRAIREDWPELH